MNRIGLFISLLLIAFACSSQKPVPPKAQKWINQFASDSCFYSAGVGIVVSDLQSEKVIAKKNERLGLTAASTLKLVTTATALEILGADYRFKTEILAEGEIHKGVLNGNLIVKGYGDPSLDSKYFPEQESITSRILSKLKERKIHTIKGKIIADKEYLNSSIPATWIWEDIGNYYGAVPHALSYRDNMYTLYFESGKAGSKTKIKKTDPEFTGLSFDNKVMSSTINRDLAYIFGGNTSEKRRIEGTIPQNRKSFKVKGALLAPENSLIYDLKKTLEKSGILLENQITKKGSTQVIQTIYSPPLKDIVYFTNQKSVNLFADHLLFEIAKHQTGTADWKSGIKAMKDYWIEKGISTKHLKLFDGSGLSHFNAISAEFLNDLLSYMSKSRNKDTFARSLAIAGVNGTLKYFGKKSVIVNHWKAKTGSMTGVRSYSGYLTTKEGKQYAISIILNNYTCKSSDINNKILNLLIKLYNS
jgi:D-alanyl-D-alanine carboxypeptidase/D-alanyl-D-alanine-endopeptidase (penicillin-binding protein 4)